MCESIVQITTSSVRIEGGIFIDHPCHARGRVEDGQRKTELTSTPAARNTSPGKRRYGSTPARGAYTKQHQPAPTCENRGSSSRRAVRAEGAQTSARGTRVPVEL